MCIGCKLIGASDKQFVDTRRCHSFIWPLAVSAAERLAGLNPGAMQDQPKRDFSSRRNAARSLRCVWHRKRMGRVNDDAYYKASTGTA